MRKTLLTLAVIAGFVSCKKADTTTVNPCPVNTTNIAGTYKVSAVTYKTNASAAEADLFTSLPDCQKDDTYELKADGSINTTDAGTSCGLPPSPGDVSGWTLESNNSILRMSETSYIIESFNCSKLVIYQSGVSIPGDKRTTTYTKLP